MPGEFVFTPAIPPGPRAPGRLRLQTPKFKVPFQIQNGAALVVEQDSTEEVVQCVNAILRTPVGTHIDEPELGLPELAFTDTPEHEEIRDAIDRWEPRARYVVTEGDVIDLAQNVDVEINER